jgi:2-(1,2-epoxy-1,2-dihydrophenyl)acetyl-CoA isomerase
MYENLIYQTNEGVAHITLNRPQVYNALSPKLIEEITAAVLAAGQDSSVRVLVITGMGDKAFCTGADLKAGMGDATSLGDSLRKRYNPMILAIRQIPKPVICRMNGIAAGAGCSLALACDVIVAADTAYMSQIFVNIALVPDAGSTFFLPRMLGSLKAFELASTGRKVMAAECLELGLVSQVTSPEGLDDATNTLAQMYAQGPTHTIGLIKQNFNKSLNSTLEEILEIEAVTQDQAAASYDAGEGIGAFLQKRKANFKGK